MGFEWYWLTRRLMNATWFRNIEERPFISEKYWALSAPFSSFLMIVFRLVLSCRPSFLLVHQLDISLDWSHQQTATLSPRYLACALSACMMILVSFFFFLSFLLIFSLSLSFFAPFSPSSVFFCPSLYNTPLLVLFFGCTHVCTTAMFLVLSRRKWYGMVYHRSLKYRSLCVLALRCTYYFILFAFFHRDVYCTTAACFVFCDHGLDFRKMSYCENIIIVIIEERPCSHKHFGRNEKCCR